VTLPWLLVRSTYYVVFRSIYTRFVSPVSKVARGKHNHDMKRSVLERETTNSVRGLGNLYKPQ
jgi:hypothetical protein